MTEEGAPAHTEHAVDAVEKSCTACGSKIPKTGVFCPNCGTHVMGAPPPYVYPPQTWTGWPARNEQPSSSTRGVFKAIAAVLILSFAIVLTGELVTLVYGAKLVGPDIFDSNLHWHLFVITPVLVTIVSISGNYLLGYYIFLIGAIIASSAWVLLSSVKVFGNELTTKAVSKDHSPLFDVGALLFATIFFSLVTALLFGGSGPSSDNTLPEMLLALASASVWEELVSRVLLIGVPLLVIHLIVKRTHSLHKYLLGGGFKLGAPEVALIVFSGIMFGVAHYVGGWGLWKIAPASVGGFAFGYLFLRHGLAAAVVLHFGTDYLTMPSEVFNSMGLLGIMGILELVWAGAGAVFFAYFIVRVIEYLTRKDLFAPRPRPQAVGPWGYIPVQQYPPRATGPSQGQPMAHAGASAGQQVSYGAPVSHGFGMGYICPACGGREARWIEGRFQCLSCGRLS